MNQSAMNMVLKAAGSFFVFFFVVQLIVIVIRVSSDSYTIDYGVLLMVLLLRTLALVVVALLYFIPSFVAHRRGHHQMLPIFLLNLFLGWSLIGWVAALVWATLALDKRRNNA